MPDINLGAGIFHMAPKRDTRVAVPWESNGSELRRIPLGTWRKRFLRSLESARLDGVPYGFLSGERSGRATDQFRAQKWQKGRAPDVGNQAATQIEAEAVVLSFGHGAV